MTLTITLNDLIPTKIANDIKELCTYTCEGEYNNYQEWLQTMGHDDDEYYHKHEHIYELAESIKKWINKEVPF